MEIIKTFKEFQALKYDGSNEVDLLNFWKERQKSKDFIFELDFENKRIIGYYPHIKNADGGKRIDFNHCYTEREWVLYEILTEQTFSMTDENYKLQFGDNSEFYNPNDKRIIKKDNVRYQVIKYDHFNMSETLKFLGEFGCHIKYGGNQQSELMLIDSNRLLNAVKINIGDILVKRLSNDKPVILTSTQYYMLYVDYENSDLSIKI